MSIRHPMQPVVLDGDVVRFHRNRIVSWMLETLRAKGVSLNEIAITFDRLGEHNDDYQQLMQLIGYSVSGYGDLSSANPDVVVAADMIANRLRK